MNGRFRSIVSVVLSVLLSLTTVVASLSVWADRTALNSRVFSQNAKEILAMPEVVDAISTFVVDELLEEASKASIPGLSLVGNLLRGTIDRQVQRVLRNEAIQSEVLRAMSATHVQVVSLLESKSESVVFDLSSVFRAVNENLIGDGVFPVNAITNEDLGQVFLYRDDSSASVKDGVKQAQDAVRLFRQALMLTLILMPILLIAVVVSAPARWSAARNVFSSLLFSSLLVVAIIVLTRGIIPDLGESEVNRAATTEVVNSLTQTFFISAVVAFVVSLTGVVLTVGNGRLAQAVIRKTRHQG
jgi:hypothetical protein